MLSRFYQKNFGSNESSGKSNRVRITLKDRLNSKYSSFQLETFDEKEVTRQNTVGKLLRSRTQQVFYPPNLNNRTVNSAILKSYNSNFVNNGMNNRQLTAKYTQKNDNGTLFRSKTNEIAYQKTQTKLINSVGTSTIVSYLEEGSENERANSNRDQNILYFGLFHVESESVLNDKLKAANEDADNGKQVADTIITNCTNIERNVTLYKQELPCLEIIPEKELNGGNEYIYDEVSTELFKLHELIFSDRSEVSIKLKLPRLNKAAFMLIKFNLLFHLAAIVIQCYFRRYLCKKYYKLRKIGPIEILNASALHIQACWRSFLLRFGICSSASYNNIVTIKSSEKKVSTICLKNDKCDSTLHSRYKWSYYHQKYLVEIMNKREISAKIIQFYWKDLYLHKFNIKHNIILNSIISARYLAKETIGKYIIGFNIRKKMDSRYKLIPVKWDWNTKQISSVFILIKANGKWSNKKKMWFSEDSQAYKYNLYLAPGNYELVFIVTDNNCSDGKSKILCNSSLETVKNKEFQFVNVIRVNDSSYKTSAFKYLREKVSSLMNRFNDFEEENIDYASLSPSCSKVIDCRIEEKKEGIADSPNYCSFDMNNSTPSTNIDSSPLSNLVN